MSLTKLALKRPVSMALVILALVVFGLSSVAGFRLELTPDMELPMLLVYTIYPGADPESVEELVTKEVEAKRFRTEWCDYVYFAVCGKYVHGHVPVRVWNRLKRCLYGFKDCSGFSQGLDAGRCERSSDY